MFSSSLRTAPRYVLPAYRTLRSFSPSRDLTSTARPGRDIAIEISPAHTFHSRRLLHLHENGLSGHSDWRRVVLEMLSHYKVTTDTVDRSRVTPAVGMALADEILGERSGATDASNAVTHTCTMYVSLPSIYKIALSTAIWISLSM